MVWAQGTISYPVVREVVGIIPGVPALVNKVGVRGMECNMFYI